MPEAPLPGQFEDDNQRPALAPVNHADPVYMLSRKRAHPGCAIDSNAARRFLAVLPPKANRNKPPRMVVKIKAPVIADKMMEIDAAAKAFENLPSIKVCAAALAAVDLFGRAEERP